VVVQFHRGALVTGAADSSADDAFCRCIVVAVRYRLSPESMYLAASEDGITVLRWITKQANLAACGRTMEKGTDVCKTDSFGAGSQSSLKAGL
jgi:acetyl esterase/lipase